MVGLHMECIWRDISAYFPSNTRMYFDRDVFRHRLIQIPGVQCKTLVEQWSPIGDGDIVLALANWVRHILKLLVDASV